MLRIRRAPPFEHVGKRKSGLGTRIFPESVGRLSGISNGQRPPRPMPVLCLPGSQRRSLASSSPACAKRSACSHLLPNFTQDRSCHEQGRPARVYVIIRDGTHTRRSNDPLRPRRPQSDGRSCWHPGYRFPVFPPEPFPTNVAATVPRDYALRDADDAASIFDIGAGRHRKRLKDFPGRLNERGRYFEMENNNLLRFYSEKEYRILS